VFLHQGGERIAAGDYEFRNRVYSSSLGRWLSNDPLGFEAGDQNWYRAVGNNPGNGGDPWGLDFYYLVDPVAIGGNGHAAIVIGPVKPPDFLLNPKKPIWNSFTYKGPKLNKDNYYYFYLSINGLTFKPGTHMWTWDMLNKVGFPYNVEINSYETERPKEQINACGKLPLEILKEYPRYKAYCGKYSSEKESTEYIENAWKQLNGRYGYLLILNNCAIFGLKCIKPNLGNNWDNPKPRPNQIYIEIEKILKEENIFEFYDCSKIDNHIRKEPNRPLIQYMFSLIK
jgi:RHS repeat-associated protein